MSTPRTFLPITSVLILCVATAMATGSDAASRVAEARTLRAQIDRMDHDVQALESQIYRIEHTTPADPTRAEKVGELHARIQRTDQEQDSLLHRLHTLEREDPAIAAESERADQASSPTDHYGTPQEPAISAEPAPHSTNTAPASGSTTHR